MKKFFMILALAAGALSAEEKPACWASRVFNCHGYVCESECVVEAPRRTCLVTHILECDVKGCNIMCADGTACRKDGYPIKWGTTVECAK